ncbi:PTS transmembrane [Streptomyces pristinaespiralis ATCC 25486]|uniref:PTS transmembrane n=1 Tax=Streptomyces pristinaespiralis (strain ATCC 25486 / DSM 40338 / CBS 914.69 / JCM 4507 / KCC S-0507 / NBRC 13074 / NRRL 2958 / 5647) TaxID=457429 RepID=B5HGB2_STRE2|nr:PTS transmembrane [Streptomyces pristinaespiralis ATCC 25486]
MVYTSLQQLPNQACSGRTPMSTESAAAPRRKWWNGLFQGLQKIGRSLQLPVAVLPAAGLLVSLGNLFGASLDGPFWERTSEVLIKGGGGILDGSLGLPLLFCIGVAIGFAKKADGSTALAAVAGFLVYYNVLKAFPVDGTVTEAMPDGTPQNPGVLGGILIGLLTAVVWQRYHRTRLVDWLGFFNGRRLVPIMMAFICCVLGVLFGLLWDPVGDALTAFSKRLIDLGAWGAGIFGVANRLLIPIGMHQFLNTFFWFQAGEYRSEDGTVVQGDLTRFFAGDPDAGLFHVGLLPDHDVRPSGGRPGDHPLRAPGAPQARGRSDVLGRPDFVRDGCDGADRVFLHVRGAAALRSARAADRGVDGDHLGAGGARGLQLLRGPDRLRRQLAPGHKAVADPADRRRVRGGLLRGLPAGDHFVQHSYTWA